MLVYDSSYKWKDWIALNLYPQDNQWCCNVWPLCAIYSMIFELERSYCDPISENSKQ